MKIDRHRSEAERAIQAGCVREIHFANGTYQLEVVKEGGSFWPFLQLDDRGNIKDAFCTCSSEDPEGCLHLAIAYLKILNGKEKPLHLRFENSFWNAICSLSADHMEYDARLLEKKREGEYRFTNDMLFSIKAKGRGAKQLLNSWIEKRVRETPENSIKFSNLPPDEVAWWREGRPSPALRYALSFWSDLAKWALGHQESAKITFEEREGELPTKIAVSFPEFEIFWEIKPADLERVIPTLNTVNASLKLFKSTEEKIKSISYQENERRFVIERSANRVKERAEATLLIGRWAYYPGLGFTEKTSSSFLLTRNFIEKNEIPDFLESHAEEIRPFIAIHEKNLPLAYAIHFDPKWNWHFSAYVLEKGDLQQPGAALYGRWAYLPNRGFYPIEDILFETTEVVLSPAEVSYFIHHHRIWLNGQEGFQTHLASIESHLNYVVTGNHNLRFSAKLQGEATDLHDFGDWVYYSTLGFFSKQHARIGPTIRPGIEIGEKNVSLFINQHREDLQNIPHFFTTHLPLTNRGLEVVMKSETSLSVKPVYIGEEGIIFFGDFVYKEGEGFCELPLQMRLPEAFEEEVMIPSDELSYFVSETLPHLKAHILHLDTRLQTPKRCDVEVDYLVRTGLGGLKASLFIRTEFGKVPISLLAAAFEKKQEFLLSEGGLLDLGDPRFTWIRGLTHKVHPELHTVQLTTLEFLRLDATFSLLNPPDGDSSAEITRNLLRELREFSSHEPPNIRGLKSELRLYQQNGLQWLWFLYKNGLSALLCDDMGLGKTHQAMALIAATLNQKEGEKKRFLVVCPTSVIYHWEDKLKIFLPQMRVHTFHGTKRSLKALPKEGLILTTYGILRVEQEALEKIHFEVAIFDEIQLAKNPASRMHEALSQVKARMRIGLTGTPIENNLRELKALFDIVLPGYMPGETRFREMFINPIEKGFDEEKKELLTKLIRPFVLRRRKSEVLQELPEKSEDKSYCDLSQDQLKLYQETLTKESDELISQLRDRGNKINYVHVFALLSRLKQICNHPALVHKDPLNFKKYASGKWDLFVELLEEARESEQKVVIFSQYLYMLDIMEHFLKEKGWGYAQIRGDTVNRREELRRFQEDPECVVFIGSLQAAGLGIDLTAASVVFMYDRWWNAARENQAIDRVHRLGQKWGVQVYKLITKGTIEEKIDRMITRKGQLLEDIIGSEDQAVLKKFSRSELIDLLSFPVNEP